MEVLLGVQILHCEEERDTAAQSEDPNRNPPPQTPSMAGGVGFPQESPHGAGLPTPSDLSVFLCFGVVYCLLGHVASTSGGTLRRT